MTMTDAPEASPEVTPLDRVIRGYLSRIDAGEAISRDDLLAQHFDLREELQEFFDDNDLMQQLAGTQSALVDTSVSGHLNTVMINSAAPLHTSRVTAAGGITGPFPIAFGQYRILRALGEGAMGLVYLAEDVKLGRKVALKVPQPSVVAQPENLARFRREAQASAGLRHHNICPVYEVNEINGTHYIAMAFIEGKPLSDEMRKDPQWSATQIADTVCRIATALDVAHRAGIIHRDLKPANIMIDPDGDPIVTDFGLACYMHAEEQVPLTLDGAVLGTPSYMSPEQLRKELGKVGPASDIYGLGVIMYELLTGQRPFSGPMLMLLLDIVNEHKTPQKPSEIRPGCHPQLEAICLKMLSKSVTDRHRSMKEVAAELTDFLKVGQLTHPSAAKTIEPQSSPMTVGSMFSIRPPWTRLSLMLGGFAALVFCGWIIIKITNKDGKETIITAKEGTQIDLQTEPDDKVSITRKEKAPLKVELLEVPVPDSRTFESGVQYAVGLHPYSSQMGDFNNDGKLDLVNANSGSHDVSLLLGNGDGTFQSAASFAAGAAPESVTVADFNADGNLDLVAANNGSHDVSLFPGNGDGTFQAPGSFAVTPGPKFVVNRDFNDDGRPDLVVGHNSRNGLSVLLNNGVGGFGTMSSVATHSSSFVVLEADFNGDGKADLANVGSSPPNLACVMLGHGDGTFGTANHFIVNEYPNGMAVGDLNHDGKPDLVTANYNAGKVNVLLNSTERGAITTSFSTAVAYTVGSQLVSVIVGDFDADGHSDLAVADYVLDRVALLQGKGDGTFHAMTICGQGTNPSSVASGDLNGDGKLDLVVSNHDSNTLTVLLNTGK